MKCLHRNPSKYENTTYKYKNKYKNIKINILFRKFKTKKTNNGSKIFVFFV